MLAVERRDGRSLPEVGFPMEQNELEEGEALSDHREDGDAGVNPDTDFAYLDDKVRQYLGHFQKDFEGCVSAENLGSRYGAYGSFLPSYQRSPSVLARPKSPPLSQRANNLQLENGRRLNLLPVNELLSRKRTPPFPNAVSTVVQSQADNVHKTETVTSKAPSVGENSPKHDFLNKAPSATDQKTLKVRIKMGPETAFARKNAAIYSGLGLDISPSSSVEDSHGGSVHLSPNSSVVTAESPKAVIQMMSSYMNPEEKFNSPLQESLLYLQERVSLFPKRSRKDRHDVFDSRYHEPRHGEKKRKSGYGSDTTSCLNVDFDMDSMESKELGSNALKLPHLMEPKCASGRSNSVTTIREFSKESSSLDAKQELDSNSVVGTHKSDGLLPSRVKGNTKESKGSSILEDKKAGARKYMPLEQRTEGQTFDVGTTVMDSVKGINDESVAYDMSLKKVVAQDPVIIPQGKEDSCPSKMKMKRSHSSGTESIEPSQETSMPVTVVQSKEKKKGLQTRDVPYETKGSHGKHLKELSKVGRDFHQEAFGDLRVEVESRADLADFNSMVEPKVQRLEEKDSFVPFEKLKDKSNSRKHGNNSELESRSKIPTENAVPGTVETSEAGASLVAPAVVIKEHWVACDRCQKWRLLPLDLDPDFLPKKWHCSMITWLPGMNKCSISQDETTKAVQAFYQIPVPESQSVLIQREEGTALESAPENVLFHQQCHDPNLNPISIGKRKKQTLSNDIVNAPSRSTLITAPHAVKKNQQVVVKSKSINDVNQSSAEHNFANGPTNLSNCQIAFTPELVQFDAGERHDGKGKQPKNKSRRESDHDSKKIKTEDSEFANDGWLSGRESGEKLHADNGVSAKSGRTTALGLILRDQKDDATSVLMSSRKKEKPGATSEENKIQAPEVNKSNSADLTSKKRKIKDRQEGAQPETLVDVNYDKEEMSESDKRTAKKTKMYKSKGTQNKEDYAEEEGKLTDNLEIEKRNYDTNDSQRKDSRYKIDSSMAATSSSSKVSGSRKNKSNMKDLKGSPVESVSSSPLRGSYASEKLTVSLRSASREKVDTANVGLSYDEGAFGLSGNGKKDKEPLPIRACNGVSKAAETLSLENTPLVKKVDATKLGTCPLDEENAILVDRHNGNAPVSVNISGGVCHEKKRDQDGFDLKSSIKYDNGAHEHIIDRGSTSRTRRKNQMDDDKPICFSERGNSSKGGDLSACREKSRNKDYKSKNSVLKNSPANLSNENVKHNGLRVNENMNFAASAPMAKGNLDSLTNGISISQQSPARMHGEKRTAYPKEVRAERSASKGKPLPPGKKQDLQRHSLSHGGPSRSKGKSDVVAPISNAELQKQQRKTDTHAAVHPNLPRHLTSNATAGRDLYVPSPARKDHSQLGLNALKEAKDLKHKADNMQKLGGLEFESVNMYFQAALKFLYGASLLEHGHIESAKNGESTQSMQIYSQTAKLCEYCAHEYERQKDMAAACLAYKCMEMAYMRVTYIKNFCATKDRSELQAALNTAPRGGSPSSSASDIDNANNQAAIDKAGPVKPLCSGVASNHVSVACNRSIFVRFLNFTQDINFALEALSKSQIAFAAANTNVENSTYGHEGISSVRRVLDFNVHDVDGMLHLIRVAMESISR